MTELLAPGGSFQSALAALNHGADALYCGLNQFSARKSAKNLNMMQLSRIREAVEQQGKRLYVALNTLIQDSQWEEMYHVLYQLQALAPHGLILQDLGLMRFIQREFPAYELHASTQMTIHNSRGARQALEMGLTRAVLARECSLEDIRRIRKEVPDLELECFIHGAHCVSVSGLCLASGTLLGRSANRGECGQICRTWFQQGDRQGYFFSARDMRLGPDVSLLQEEGVRSLKIEGRMKSPEYAAWTTAWYRALLDGAPKQELEQLEEKSRIAFSRESTTGWLKDSKGDRMIQSRYPGHQSVSAGVILSDGRVLLSIPLSERDGLLYLPPPAEGNRLPEGESFAVRFSAAPGKKRRYFARADEVVRLTHSLKPGGELRCISRHDGTLPQTKEESLPEYRIQGSLYLSWQNGVLKFTCRLPFGDIPFSIEEPFTEARQSGLLQGQIAGLFQGKGGPVDIQEIIWGEGNWEGGFIPASRLKAIRREFRSYLEERLKTPPGKYKPQEEDGSSKNLPDRDRMQQRQKWNPGGGLLPFVAGSKDFKLEDLQQEEGRYYLPLNPFLRQDEDYNVALETFLQQHADQEMVLGLNNPSHLQLCKELKDRENVSFWVDYGLYCANKEAFKFYLQQIPRLRAVVYWLEGPAEEAPEGSSIIKDFSAPLFTSASCYHHHSLENSCPESCPKSYRYTLHQKNREYQVVVRECISYLFLKEQGLQKPISQ